MFPCLKDSPRCLLLVPGLIQTFTNPFYITHTNTTHLSNLQCHDPTSVLTPIYGFFTLESSGRGLLEAGHREGYRTSDTISDNTEVKTLSQLNQIQVDFPGRNDLKDAGTISIRDTKGQDGFKRSCDCSTSPDVEP